MTETSISITFEIYDLNALYEVYGTSKDYSFQYKLGRGSDLVFNEGDEFTKIIPLDGNYGDFEIRVYCESDIGVKSESLVDNVSVSAPGFTGTFTFNRLAISSESRTVMDSLEITKTPEDFGDSLEASQIFNNKNLLIEWDLLPPKGHPKEGEALSDILLVDSYFSHFKINLYSNGALVNVDESFALTQLLGTANVSGALHNYRNFSIEITEDVFEDLNLSRTLVIEVICVNSLGEESSASLQVYNPPPDIEMVDFSKFGNRVSIDWDYIGDDSTYTLVRYLALPERYELYNKLDFDESYEYLQRLRNSADWESLSEGDDVSIGEWRYITLEDAYGTQELIEVYECITSHSHDTTVTPNLSDHWTKVGEKVEFLIGEQNITAVDNSIKIDQLWGYKYYYQFTPYDIFGPAEPKNLSEDKMFGEELFGFLCKVKIANLKGAENGDSFLFTWDFVDENNKKIDINDYKFTTLENEVPSILGVRARIYDYDIIDSGNLLEPPSLGSEFINIPGFKFATEELRSSTINISDGSTYEERTILHNTNDGQLFLDSPLPDTHRSENCTYVIVENAVLKMTLNENVLSKIVIKGTDNNQIDFISSEAAIFDRFEYTRELNNLLYDPSYEIGPYTERDDGGKRSITFEVVLVGVDSSYNLNYEDRVFVDQNAIDSPVTNQDLTIGTDYQKASQVMLIDKPMRVTVDNPAPYILPGDEFRRKIDSLSETTKVKFNFNYALNFQERVTKINLYRIDASEVETYDADGNVISKDFSSFNLENNLVQVIEGPGNNTYGDNITQIIDIPPESQDAQGYYYRILPFDDFGSGVLYNVPNGPGADLQTLEKINIYPRSLSSTDPVGPPGKVLRSDPTLALGAVPGAPINFDGKTVFENYFLSWQAPQFDQDPDNPGKMLLWSENDIDHYEVWKSNNANEDTLKINDSLWSNAQNTGYRKVDGVIYTVGETPKVLTDPALNITNATNIFNVDGRAQKIETSYPGATREESHFWVRAVDLAGNKSPFTGAYGQDGVEGLTLRLNSATATDIDDFEISMTSGFADSIALVPNNPFRDNTRLNGSSEAGWISWPEHVLYNEGTGYIVSAGETDQGYVWWDRNNSSSDLNLENYTVKINGNEVQYNGQPLAQWQEFSYDDGDEWGGVKNIYFKGLEYELANEHPSNNPDHNIPVGDPGRDDPDSIIKTSNNFDNGDFVVVRNTNGISTPVHQAFANALIGTANIAEAAIKTAHIHDLSADKITAGKIQGHRIDVYSSTDPVSPGTSNPSVAGSIGSTDFYGLEFQESADLLKQDVYGFVLSGDGSFAFQQGLNSLSFEGEELMLRGRMKQKNNKDYDFVDINPSPRYFNYIEDEEGFKPLSCLPSTGNGDFNVEPDGISQEVAALNITFRNSSITQAGDIQVKALRVRSADQVFENIFYDSTDDGWISISDLNPNSVNYKPAYGFRWNISDYTEEYNAGPGVFSAIIRLPVFVENKDSDRNNISPPDQTSDPNYASFKHSYHSLISEPAGEYDDAIFVYARSVHSDIQKEAIIARITDGKASESLRLTSSSQIFELDKDLNPVQGDVSGANAATISLSLDRQGNNQAIQWESAEVPIYSATTGNTITTYDATKGKYISSFAGDTYVRIKIEDFLNTNQNPKNPETYIKHPVAKITVRSKAPQDIYGNNTGPELEEEVSIFVVREGSDNIVAALDNETHTCHFLARYEYEKNGLAETPQSNTSNNEYLNSGTTIKVIEGNRPLTFAANPSAGQFKVTATPSTQNGQNEIQVGNIAVDTSDDEIAIVGDHSKILDTAYSIYIDYLIEGRTYGNVAFSLNKRQTITVSRDGETSKALLIHATSYIFSEDKDIYGAAALSPEYIQIFAEKKNIIEDVKWTTEPPGLSIFSTQIDQENAVAAVTGQDQVYIKREHFHALSNNKEITIKAVCDSDGFSDAFSVSDTLTINRTKDGENVADVKLTNPNHSLSEINESGVFDYGGSGTSVIVYDGPTRLKPVTSASLSPGQFRVTSVTASTNGSTADITQGGVKGINDENENSYSIEYHDSSGMPDSVFSATITYSIQFRKRNGATGTLEAVQTISKSIAGTSIKIIFKRSTNPNSETITQFGNNIEAPWYDNVESASQTGFLWASRGEKKAGETTYVWGNPFRVEGEAVAEVYLYRLVSQGGGLTENDKPLNSYDFVNNSINTSGYLSSWSTAIPQITQNNQSIWVSVGLFAGAKNQSSVDAQGGWSTPSKFVERIDAQAVDYWFARGNTAPAYRTDGENPDTAANQSSKKWYTEQNDIPSTHSGYLWVIKSTEKAGTTTAQKTFDAPFKLDGDEHAEITIYYHKANDYNMVAPSAPTSGVTFDFSPPNINIDQSEGSSSAGWADTPASQILNGDSVYACKLLFSSYRGDSSVEPSVTSSVWLFQRREDGGEVNYFFIKSASSPIYNSVSGGYSSVPHKNNSESTISGAGTWSDDIGSVGGTGYLWSIKGKAILPTHSAFNPNLTKYTWSAPRQIEGDVAAEVEAYQLVEYSAGKPNEPTIDNFNYNFDTGSFSPIGTSDWKVTPPDTITNGQKLYGSKGLFVGYKDHQTARTSNWSEAYLIQQKKDGGSINYFFIKSDSTPIYHDADGGYSSVPHKNNSESNISGAGTWSDDIGSAAGSGYLWSIKGTALVVGDSGFVTSQTKYTWSTPKRIETDAVAEITLFKKVANQADAPSAPSFTYNFSDNSVNQINDGWSLNNFEDIQNGEKIYSSTALFASYQGDAAASPLNDGWGDPILTQKRKDGVATTYRGIWNDLNEGTQFNGSDFRGDVVKYKTGATTGGGLDVVEYYICVNTHNKGSITPPNSGNWEYFGSIFDSFATGVLISEKSFVGDELQIGEDGLGGVLRSPGFKGGIFDADSKQPINDSDDYTIAGYLLATDSANNVFFDVGGINPRTEDLSFIRYSSLTGKVEIKGTFINNSVNSNVVSSGASINQSLEEYINSLQGTQDFDNIAYFIGGGYNNTFNNTGYEADNIASSIVGGAQNLISSHFSSIVGGYENQCRDNFSVIGGGWINTMSAVEEGNIQGANGILSGIKNNINGGSNQTIINGVDNKIEQTSPGDQNGGLGGVKLDIINAITGPRYFGIPDGNHAVFSAESDSWIYSSWFPGYEVNNFSDYFFISSPTHENQWLFSVEFGWTYINWKTPTSMKTYLPEGSDIDLNIYTQWEDGLEGWWIITKPVSETFLFNSPSYLTMYKDGVGWYFVRRTADNKTQAWQSSGITAWSAGTAYNVGNLVHYGGYRWECQTDHTSSSSVYPNSGSSIWTNIGNSWQTAKSN